MVDIIKAKQAELAIFIEKQKAILVKAEAKFEVYNEILAEVGTEEEKPVAVEETTEESASNSAEPFYETENNI